MEINSPAPQGVTSLNSLTGAVTLAAGSNISITPAGNTLTIASTASGASIGGAITGGTAGSVLFVNPSNTFAQNNANFFWDNTNARLGIGTTTPTQSLQVLGNIEIGVDNAQTGAVIQKQLVFGEWSNNPAGLAPSFIFNHPSNWGGMGNGAVGGNTMRIGAAIGAGSGWPTFNTISFNLVVDGKIASNVNPSVAAPGAQLHIIAGSSTTIGAIVQSFTGQSANLQEWQNSGGGIFSYMNNAGSLNLGNNAALPDFAAGSLQVSGYVLVANNKGLLSATFAGSDTTLFRLNTSDEMETLAKKYYLKISGSDAFVVFDSPSGITGMAHFLGTVAGVNYPTATFLTANGQVKPTLQLQALSSTATPREQVDLGAYWATATDATRKARFILSVWDTATRESIRTESDGSFALTSIGGATIDALTTLKVTAPSATYIGQTIKAATSQSADLQCWQNSSATNLGRMQFDGTFATARVAAGLSGPTWGTVQKFLVNANNTPDNAATAQINATATGNKVLVLQAYTGQTANILEAQKSDATPLFEVGPTGTLAIGSGAVTSIAVGIQFGGGTITNTGAGGVTGIQMSGTLANTFSASTITGLYLYPTANVATATTITDFAALYLSGANMAKTGSGTITNAYGLLVDAPSSLGTNNYAVYIKANTSVTIPALVIPSVSGQVGINNNNPGAQLEIDVNGASTKGLIVKGAASQSASLAEFQSSAGAAYVTVGPSTMPNDGSQQFLNVAAALPATANATTDISAIKFQITSAGSVANYQKALYVQLLAGYTGGQYTAGIEIQSNVAGTATNWASAVGNFGFYAASGATTTGSNIGGYGYAAGGNVSIGFVGNATNAKNSATNVGAVGLGYNTGSSPIQVGGFFGLMNGAPTFASAALMADNGGTTSDIFVARDNGTAKFSIIDGGNVSMVGTVSTYNNVATTGWGHPAIYGSGRSTAQTAAVTSVATYTVGAADGSFIVSANVNVTTATLFNFVVQVTYTDETNTARTETFNFSTVGGVLSTVLTNATGAVPYESIPLHIRCKAATAITIKTANGGGTNFTTVVYNVEGYIQQIG